MASLEEFIASVPDKMSHCQTEEATKTALILPLLQILGWDIFSPTQVVPEYSADVGIKRGERVDYALMINDKVEVLIECKTVGTDLDKYSSQLFRYFAVTEAKVAVLTDGVIYYIYTDGLKSNIMDMKPIYTFDMTRMSGTDVKMVSMLSRITFSADEIKQSMIEYGTGKAVLTMFNDLFSNPTDNLINALYKVFNMDYNSLDYKVTKSTFKSVFSNIVLNLKADDIKSICEPIHTIAEEHLNVEYVNKTVSENNDCPSIFDDIDNCEDTKVSKLTMCKNYRQQVMSLGLVPLPMTCILNRGSYSAICLLNEDFTVTVKRGAIVRKDDSKFKNYKQYQSYISADSITTKDLIFKSVSTASSFITGKVAANGWDLFEYMGMTLGEWFRSQAKANNIPIDD